MKVHIIQHDSWVEPGEYLSWARRHGYPVSFTRCWQYEKLPEEVQADLLIVLGGYQCPATTKEECGYFDAQGEIGLIRRYVSAGKAVVGVCLGAQLVGEAMGAPYEHSPEREIGPVQAWLTQEGKKDPFLKRFPGRFMAGEWHNDMPGLTEQSAVLAESQGCPRQIVRYGTYVYGFQTHMEFTPEIIRQGIQNAGEDLKTGGPFVQTREELLAFDYRDMNRMLSDFLDAMMEDYEKSRKAAIAQILEKMIAFCRGNLHDIDHLIRVWTYAKTIGELEGLDEETQYLLEVAAITHDIACPLCREKYGNTNGRHQEEEGALLVKKFLEDTGMDVEEVERVAFLVGHHHTLSAVDGIDFQILIEADFIANASENLAYRKNVENFKENTAKTESGKRLIGEVLSRQEENH